MVQSSLGYVFIVGQGATTATAVTIANGAAARGSYVGPVVSPVLNTAITTLTGETIVTTGGATLPTAAVGGGAVLTTVVLPIIIAAEVCVVVVEVGAIVYYTCQAATAPDGSLPITTVINPVCPAGQVYSGVQAGCIVPPWTCPAGQIYSVAQNGCIVPPLNCPPGQAYDDKFNQCVAFAQYGSPAAE